MRGRNWLAIALVLGMLLSLAGCGGAGEDISGDITGDWYMGSDGEYRYMIRFGADGTVEILQALTGAPETGTALTFTLSGTYTLEGNALTRQYDNQDRISADSVLLQTARIRIAEDTLWLDYTATDLVEYWIRMPEGGADIFLGNVPQTECAVCAGRGIMGYETVSARDFTGSDRDSYILPIWCDACGGLGTIAGE